MSEASGPHLGRRSSPPGALVAQAEGPAPHVLGELARPVPMRAGMSTIENIIQAINGDIAPQFEQRLRRELETHDKEWLIEQIVRLTLDAHSLQKLDRRLDRRQKARRIAERAARLREMKLDEAKLVAFVERYRDYTRERLIEEGYLLPDAPIKGTDLITEAHRSEEGQALLTEAKDILFGLLFGSGRTNTWLERTHQELLSMTVPRLKAHALDFMQATTELSVFGTWQDPDSISDDERAENVILEVEYGELKSERVGDGVITTLRLINNLEINEQILYARMMDIEQSTLIS